MNAYSTQSAQNLRSINIVSPWANENDGFYENGIFRLTWANTADYTDFVFTTRVLGSSCDNVWSAFAFSYDQYMVSSL